MNRWPKARLGDIAPVVRRSIDIDLGKAYPELGIRSFGKGTFHKPVLAGSDVGGKRLFRIEPGDLIFSNVFAWEGAVAVAGSHDQGRFGSHRFITCVVDSRRAVASFLCRYLVGSREGLEQLRRASPGGAGRNRTLGVKKLADIKVPLPPRDVQQSIVARLDALVDRTNQLTAHLDAIEADAKQLLAMHFRDAIVDAPYFPMADVAPLVRREVVVDPESHYPELGIRSFGKGSFHKPEVSGLEIGTKRLFRIEPGDLVFSNVFAWEGAMAIAKSQDVGRVGSHRFMTCVVDSKKVAAELLHYYFLSPEGLEKIRAASPGGAGRNRTLGVEKLMALQVPVPSIHVQRKFQDLQATIDALRAKHNSIRGANAALLPATLERLFGVDGID